MTDFFDDLYRELKGNGPAKPSEEPGQKPETVAGLYLASLEEKRVVNFHHGMWFSPSMLVGCRKVLYTAVRDQRTFTENLAPFNAYSMDLGTQIHSMVQYALGKMGVLLGGWRCLNCGHVHGVDQDDAARVWSHGRWLTQKVTTRSLVKLPAVCGGCAEGENKFRRIFSFVEPMVYDVGLRVSGLMDGVLWLNGIWQVLDIKTIQAFPLRAELPYQEHREQINWYMGLSGIHSGLLLYLARSEKHPQAALRDVPVVFDEDLYGRQLAFVRQLGAFGQTGETAQENSAGAEEAQCQYGGERSWGPCECAWL